MGVPYLQMTWVCPSNLFQIKISCFTTVSWMPQYIYVCENYENAKMFFGHDSVTNRPNLFQVPYRPKCFSNGGRGTTSYVWFICQKWTFLAVLPTAVSLTALTRGVPSDPSYKRRSQKTTNSGPGYQVVKTHDTMCICLHMAAACDRQTDGRTTPPIHKLKAERDNGVIINSRTERI